MAVFPGPLELPLCENFDPNDVQYERECPPQYTGCLTQTDGKSFKRVAANYEGVSKSFRTGGLERELQMVQLSAIKCSCIAIL
jgi:hypothetical protein